MTHPAMWEYDEVAWGKEASATYVAANKEIRR
jgi:hypothetical protein